MPIDRLGLDPRVVRSCELAEAVTLELIREVGVVGVSVEAISHRSGIAKTTLYRHYADREALIFAAFDSLPGPPPVPVEHGVAADVEYWLNGVVAGFDSGSHGNLLPSIIELAQRSARGRELAAGFSAGRRRVLETRLEAAVAAGELDDGTNIDLIVSRLIGAVMFRRFMSVQDTPPAVVRQLVESVFGSSDTS